ncbi:MAG: hypothetical protein ACRDLL_05480 [Solirubrobacterales bacterium]
MNDCGSRGSATHWSSRGELAPVEGEDGGYKPSDGLTLAMHIVVDHKAEQAAMN